MIKRLIIPLAGLLILLQMSFLTVGAQNMTSRVKIFFHHKANGQQLALADSTYKNAFGEQYQVTKLRYYISNIGFDGMATKNVSLIDAAGSDSIVLDVKSGTYNQLDFTLGVDSILNCSGAQSGALDPLKGMFWTWNSGYIFFKLEGFSSASLVDLSRIEHHIGGYKDPNKVAKTISLKLPERLTLNAGQETVIHIDVNLDNYWQAAGKLSIAENALIMVPGEQAKKAAANFEGMFSLSKKND